MYLKTNKLLILENLSMIAEMARKSQKMGSSTMSAKDTHDAVMRQSNTGNIKDISDNAHRKGLMISVNSNPNSDAGGSIDSHQANIMIEQLKASGHLK